MWWILIGFWHFFEVKLKPKSLLNEPEHFAVAMLNHNKSIIDLASAETQGWMVN